MRQHSLIIVVLMCVTVSTGCVSHAPPKSAALRTAETVAGEAANNGMHSALASALQAQGKDAVVVLRALDPVKISERDAPTRSCMLERLGARKSPPIGLSDRFLAEVLATYREYWLRSLLAEHPLAENEAWLFATLNALTKAEGGKTAANMDELEPMLEALISAHGYYPLLGMTLPLRELMLWKTEAETRYDVVLPESTQAVTVVFMDDFASLGWAGFATCDRAHSGGWTKPDRLYAVRSAYDLASENFRVSYLAHEAQHFSDNRRFPKLGQQDELEYRAKLVELAVGKTSVYDLLDNFAVNISNDISVPHSYANGRVVRDMGKQLYPGATKASVWRDASIERINAVAADLLRDDTARLERAPLKTQTFQLSSPRRRDPVT